MALKNTSLKKIKLVAMDVDGVLTDGKIVIDANGIESKNFNVRDGLGIALSLKLGLQIALISGRYSKVVDLRAGELKIPEVHQKIADKKAVFLDLLARLGLKPSEAAYMGDDINDISTMKAAGFSAAPADADPQVKKAASLVTKARGGEGAARELLELVMTARGEWPRAERRITGG